MVGSGAPPFPGPRKPARARRGLSLSRCREVLGCSTEKCQLTSFRSDSGSGMFGDSPPLLCHQNRLRTAHGSVLWLFLSSTWGHDAMSPSQKKPPAGAEAEPEASVPPDGDTPGTETGTKGGLLSVCTPRADGHRSCRDAGFPPCPPRTEQTGPALRRGGGGDGWTRLLREPLASDSPRRVENCTKGPAAGFQVLT